MQHCKVEHYKKSKSFPGKGSARGVPVSIPPGPLSGRGLCHGFGNDDSGGMECRSWPGYNFGLDILGEEVALGDILSYSARGSGEE